MNIVLLRPDKAQLLEKYVEKSQSSVIGELLKPYTWLVLSILMLAVAAWMRPSPERMQILALNLSALGYYASLLAAVPSVDFRYAYWCIVATSLSMVVFLTAANQHSGHRTLG